MELKYPNKKTQIICTIGPSSWVPETMEKMIANGMDVARINGAFATPEEMLKVENLVKQFSDEVELMIDIKGPEARLNKFGDPKKIKPGDEIEIGSSEEDEIYPANYPDTYKKVKPGMIVKIGDGDVVLEITEVTDHSFKTVVKEGSLLKPGKAMNFPGESLHDSPITDKDKTLLDYAMERDWDSVSASFIRTPEDAKQVREYIKDSNLRLIAKIEDEEGLRNIYDIIPEIDEIMVARGGLGVDMGVAMVPFAERRLIKASVEKDIPAIVATQMLDSMEENPSPTRAEANDVATAILLGAEAVMLSGESTVGKYPEKAVEIMSKIDDLCQKYMADPEGIKFDEMI